MENDDLSDEGSKEGASGLSFGWLWDGAKGGGFSGVWTASKGGTRSSSPLDERGAASARLLFRVESFKSLKDGEGDAVNGGTVNFVASCLGGDAEVDVL